MSPDRWRVIEALYNDLADLPRAEQDARLAATADAELVREVRSLLQSGSAESMVVSAVASVAGAATAGAPVPQRFGPWRVTGTAGHGGMGAVYKAVRDDQAFDKQVAIKVLHLGLDSAPARERFRQERSILAGLEHPNIARLLDGGETETGVSYIVMEFVDGESIVEYCVRHGLSRAARLRLFLQVCSAVHLAHQNLVVHRDLKPGNILVTREGVPKLLDFGIAKLMEPSALRTMTGFLALTPQYASPEQIRGEPVTTASDVYSLGMVLYEMLTGRRPYEVDATAMTGIAKTVCEVQPIPPRVDPDLDNILLMALRKEPARRYASVQALADDIERALTHRPVRARPVSMTYTVGKFIRRNRVSVVAAALVLGSLSGGLAFSLRAQRRERARFDQVRSLATTFLVEFDRDIRQLPGATAARERLVKTALETLDRLAQDSARDASLTAELVQAYVSLGDVLGSPGISSLGHSDRAEQSFRKALALAQPLVVSDRSPANPHRPAAALACLRLGYLMWRTSRSDEGRQWILDGLSYLQPAIDAGKATSRDYRLAANGNAYLSQIARQNRRAREAAEFSAKSVDLMRKYQQGAEDAFRARSDLARALTVAGDAVAAIGEIARAAELQREAIRMRQENARQRPNDVENLRELAICHLFLSNVEFSGDAPSLGNKAAATDARREYYELMRRLAAADPRNDSAQHDFGLCLRQMAGGELDPVRAEAYAREGVRVMEARPPGSPSYERHVGLLWAVLASILKEQGRTGEARTAMDRAVRGFARENPNDGLARGDFHQLWRLQGDYDKVWQTLSRSIAGSRDDMYLAYDLADCARRLALAHPGQAAEWRGKVEEIWGSWKGRYPATDRALGL